MIDFHTHILPNIDDGAQSIEESLALIELLRQQKITKIIATPHFYANKIYPKDFLIERDKAFNSIKEKIPENSPEILLGAEVHYFSGMGICEELKLLTVQNTNLVLVEMPFSDWNEQIFDDLHKIRSELELTVVIAHLDRYLHLKNNKKFIKRLFDEDFLIQLNIDAFMSFFNRNTLLKLLKNSEFYLLGSDCHNLKSRPPKWEWVMPILKKNLGRIKLYNLNLKMESVLIKNQN